jgi:hypothetical protein
MSQNKMNLQLMKKGFVDYFILLYKKFCRIYTKNLVEDQSAVGLESGVICYLSYLKLPNRNEI